MRSFEIREKNKSDQEWIRPLLVRWWGTTSMVSRGKVHDMLALPAFVAVMKGAPSGLVTYRIGGGECEIVSLNSEIEERGIGTALIGAVGEVARAAACRRLWLVTTNDNLRAIGFYQRRGFHLAALHANALEVSRRLKPEIPLVGMNAIPLRDEIELELAL